MVMLFSQEKNVTAKRRTVMPEIIFIKLIYQNLKLKLMLGTKGNKETCFASGCFVAGLVVR